MTGGLGSRIREGQARLDFDARHFLEALYHEQPEGTLIAVGELTRPHFCRSPESALPWVVGRQDVYTRITLLGERPQRRGAAADSVALPGVWAEVDINGGPRAAGGVVEDGAPSVEAALELCHSVLQPTLVVRSGYGVHAYWLFERPWDIRDAEARELAGRLVEGWQRRLRAEAAALGVGGLDATHDLARVLRPAGSFNHKGDEPIPVALLDDGGPRYSQDAIDAEVLAPVVAIAAPVPAGSGRKPDELVGRYPVLARLARREGDAPGDGSESAWDYYLACEARRRVKPPIGREEAIALVAHGRGNTGKGARGDYLERTVDRAFETVRAPDAPPPASADPATVITNAWKIAADPIVAGWSTGVGLNAAIYLRRKSGDVAHFGRLADLFVSTRHVALASLELREPIPDLGKPTAVRVAQAIIALCDVRSDRGERDRDEVEEWLGAFVQRLGAVVVGDLLGEGADRWRVLVEQRAYKPDESVHGIAASTAGVRDLEGRLWIPAAAFVRHIRQVERASIGWGELLSRLDELGWEVLRVDVHEPHSGTSKAGLTHIRATFYGEPRA